MTILAPGAPAPEFSLSNQHGQPVSLGGFRGAASVTIVFFPLAFSRVCQGELRELQDNPGLFAAAGSQVVAISVDSKHALRAWAEEQGFGFPLLSDFWPHGDVAMAYGAFLPERGYAGRATFVVRDGLVRASFATGPGEPRSLDQYREALAAT
ncbi:peroxiredoxin [Agromyces sp. Marseille-P2726]|uniref:peroxiredoxin n=1 Tax=Agromyces sp. Marseille-P2726 TaxID=2709132 RepID=UPI00273A0B90|nr:peroxiredoxin [Agromyces sp. Marseille-P2726]